MACAPAIIDFRESGIGIRDSGIGNRESGIGNRESSRRSSLPDRTTMAAYCGRCRVTSSIAADLCRYVRRHGRDGLATIRLAWK
ncbi:hypothetical protein xavtCFBP7764_01065 [Xanthomonas citri]|nr:hypothetical protein xavtCFBP7764_01065 [Xanthomonas citri]